MSEKTPARPYYAAVAVLVLAQLAAVAGWQVALRDVETKDRARFNQRVAHARSQLQARFLRLPMLLESLGSFVRADLACSQAEWDDYVSGLSASSLYPGMESAGFLVPGKDAPQVKLWTQAGASGSAAPDRATLIAWSKYAENARQTGRSAVVELALLEGLASRRFALLQPVYRRGADTSSAAARPDALAGWVAVTADTHGFLDGLVGGVAGEPHPRIRFRVYDARKGAAPQLIYSNIAGGADKDWSPPRFVTKSRRQPINGSWTFEFSSTPAFDALSDFALAHCALAGGTLMSLLLFGIVASLSRTRVRALELAEQMSRSCARSETAARNLLAIANRSDNAFLIMDGQRRVLWANQTYLRYTGHQLEDLSNGRTQDALFSRATSQSAPSRCELLWRTAGGKELLLDVEVQPIPDSEGRPEYFLCIARELTPQKQSRDTLLRIQKAVECVSDGITISNRAGEHLYQNPAFQELFGYSLQQCQAAGGPLALAADPELAVRITAEARIHGSWSGEAAMRTKDGRTLDILLRLATILDDSGEPLGLVAILTDISERKHMEAELRRARDAALEASRLKSAFLSNMSHEIRTPMNGVLGMTKLLLTTNLNPEQREYADLVNVSADALLAVINDILDFSKIEAGKLDLEVLEFDLHSLIREVVALMSISARTKGLHLECRVDRHAPQTITADPNRLRQVLLNLVGNAIKFTARGKVTISVRPQHDQVRIEVSDTGLGIEPEILPRLFTPFSQADASTTRRFGGTGLGLAISKQLIELMGGFIGVRSQPGRGSNFWITLPLASQPVPAPEDQVSHIAT